MSLSGCRSESVMMPGEETFTERIELRWSRMARRAVQRVFPCKCGDRFCGL